MIDKDTHCMLGKHQKSKDGNILSVVQDTTITLWLYKWDWLKNLAWDHQNEALRKYKAQKWLEVGLIIEEVYL